MDKLDTGGPAYPTGETFDPQDGRVMRYMVQGISVRDYFAAAALPGFVAACYRGDGLTPSWADEDFVQNADPHESGYRKNKFGFWYYHTSRSANHDTPSFRVVTTLEHRIARELWKHVDAVMKARNQ